jgi:hypothetical protein
MKGKQKPLAPAVSQFQKVLQLFWLLETLVAACTLAVIAKRAMNTPIVRVSFVKLFIILLMDQLSYQRDIVDGKRHT